MKRVSVVGLGYIGLPTAVLSAESGYTVSGFDIDNQKIDHINSGRPLIVESEIEQRLSSVLKNQQFKAYNILQKADVFIIAVPTPFINFSGKKKADLCFVIDTANRIAKILQPNNLVILESTVPVGTTKMISKLLEKKSGLKLGLDFFVAYCPERVLPGQIFKELVTNDRVIGGVCNHSAQLAKKFYSKFVKGNCFLTDDKSAEMVKLIENSSRDVQIAFANQVADMCKQVNIDPYNVIDLANKHPRVEILKPGCGVGGHCIAVDPWFLIETFTEQSELLKLARTINDRRPLEIVNKIINKIEELIKKGISKPKLLLLGLTFKPDVDDIRNSPALQIAQLLNDKKDLLQLVVYDPYIEASKLNNLGLDFIQNLPHTFNEFDIVLILVKHKKFYSLNKFDLTSQIIIDECGFLNNKKKEDIRVISNNFLHERTI